VCERHTHEVLGLRESQLSNGSVSFHYRRFIDWEEIWNGARATDWILNFILVNQVSRIVISETFLEIEIERYTKYWFSQVGFPR